MAGPEGLRPQSIPSESIGVAPEAFDVHGHITEVAVDETLVQDDASIKSADEITVFKTPEGIGYRYKKGDRYATVDSKIGEGKRIRVEPQGPFPDIPKTTQRRQHQDIRDRIIIRSDVANILELANTRLRQDQSDFPGYTGWESTDENYVQNVNRHEIVSYNIPLVEESLGQTLAKRVIHKDYDVRIKDLPTVDAHDAAKLTQDLRDFMVSTGRYTEEEAEEMVTPFVTSRVDDSELLSIVKEYNINLLEGARVVEPKSVLQEPYPLDQSKGMSPTPRRRGVKVR